MWNYMFNAPVDLNDEDTRQQHAHHRHCHNVAPHEFNRLVSVDFRLRLSTAVTEKHHQFTWMRHSCGERWIRSARTRSETHQCVDGTFEDNFSNGRWFGLTLYANELSQAATRTVCVPVKMCDKQPIKISFTRHRYAKRRNESEMCTWTHHRCQPLRLCCVPRSRCQQEKCTHTHKIWHLQNETNANRHTVRVNNTAAYHKSIRCFALIRTTITERQRQKEREKKNASLDISPALFSPNSIFPKQKMYSGKAPEWREKLFDARCARK